MYAFIRSCVDLNLYVFFQVRTIEDWDDQLSVFKQTMNLNVMELRPLSFIDQSNRLSITKQRSNGTLPLLADISGIRFQRGNVIPDILVDNDVDQRTSWTPFPIFKKKFNPRIYAPTEKSLRGISAEKKKGILSLCKFMKTTRRLFWSSLLTSESVDLQIDDDE